MAGEWLTTQTYNGGTFIELVQPLSGQSMFHDYGYNAGRMDRYRTYAEGPELIRISLPKRAKDGLLKREIVYISRYGLSKDYLSSDIHCDMPDV